ncbi:MAG: hypothetical protein M1827_002597 [Pycnora praestabilis]|nr:MAG: hypothetical protein M1827_002597 [Pycnora praestabilis]
MFVQSNPGRGKSAEEKEEMKANYTPGERVLPIVEWQHEDGSSEEDRRVVEEVRQISLRDMERGLGAAGAHHARHGTGGQRRRDHNQGAREMGEGHRRRQGLNPDERAVANEPALGNADAGRGPSSLHSGLEARQIGHQSSLRSLLSASDVDSSEMEEEIKRQITEEGLLDGIDLSSIDVSQEDEISERIAYAYRRRQQERSRSETARNHETRTSPATNLDRRKSGRGPHLRSSSVVGESTEPLRPTSSQVPAQNAASRSPGERRPRRSSHSRGQASLRVSSSGPSGIVSEAARRSATDLSNRPSSSHVSQGRPRRTSDQGRRTTDPELRQPSEMWRRGAADASESRTAERTLSADQPESDAITTPLDRTLLPKGNLLTRDSIAQSARNTHLLDPARGEKENSTLDPRPSSSPSMDTKSRPSRYNEPSIECDRCRKSQIEYELHYNCSRCKSGNFNICLPCYRAGKGCLHWYGFGYAARMKYESFAPPEGYALGHPLPHLLRGHRYLRPCRRSQAAGGNDVPATDDPRKRFQTGLFCAVCHAFANECFWMCSLCNEGEWGFCNNCVNRGKCCTHALLPISHESTTKSQELLNDSELNCASSTTMHPPRAASVLRSPGIVDLGPFKPLTFSTKCDICTYPIQPSITRFHCLACNNGDYDICANCYPKLVNSGKISNENGHQGWRRCLRGHRMVIIGFEDNDEGQRRVVVKDLVGGAALKDQIADGSTEDWSWRDGPNGQRQFRKVSRTVKSAGNVSASTSVRFPPDGGVGMRVLALYSRYPDDAVTDELMFPRGAEIREVEDINGDWYWGCYAGAKGLLPGNHVKILGTITM